MAKEDTKIDAYPEGDVELRHTELGVVMGVPESAVEAWEAVGWTRSKASGTKE